MTIGIGVICSTLPKEQRKRPDAIVLLSDTMGSADTDSTDDLHKMLVDEDRRLFAVCAGRIETCADLWPCIQAEIDRMPIRNHGSILNAINLAVMGHRAQHFQYDVLFSKYYLSEKVSVAPPNVIAEELARYDTQVAMIVGLFDSDGQALLYRIQFPHYGGSWVVSFSFPGHVCIGTGSPNADFWLNYRRQRLGLSVRESLYHVFEAGKMAAKAPTVNDEMELLVATAAGEALHTSNKYPEPPKGFPLGFIALEEAFAKYGPQSTESLQQWNTTK